MAPADHGTPPALPLELLLLALASTSLVLAADEQVGLLGSPPGVTTRELLSIHAGAPENGGIEVRLLLLLLLLLSVPSTLSVLLDSSTGSEG